MAHVESYNKASVTKILKEHERTARTYKNYVDLSRSYLNWGYGKQGTKVSKTKSAILERCKNIMQGKQMQEQTNVMSEWVVTFPAELCKPVKYLTTDKKTGQPIQREYNKPRDDAQCREFFDTVWDFVRERYGSDNVISAYVHMDETTPHIAIAFVPEATSRKTGKKTVSSASLLTRKELAEFHRDLERQMQAVFGIKGMILNGRTQGGYTLQELKTRTHDNAVLDAKKKTLKAQIKELTDLAEQVEDDKTSLAFTQAEYERKFRKVAQKEKSLNEREDAVKERENDVSNRERMCDAQERALMMKAQEIADREKTSLEMLKTASREMKWYDAQQKQRQEQIAKVKKSYERLDASMKTPQIDEDEDILGVLPPL